MLVALLFQNEKDHRSIAVDNGAGWALSLIIGFLAIASLFSRSGQRPSPIKPILTNGFLKPNFRQPIPD